MLYRHGKQVKIITGNGAFDFESKLNAVLSDLNNRGIKYELQLNPSTGFLAYVVFEDNRQIPETIAEEFELGGEKHTCIECPYFVRPTDGRRKYTKCVYGKLRGRDSACCDEFYEQLADGKIELVEVWKVGKDES